MGFEMSFWWYVVRKKENLTADIAQLRSCGSAEALHLRRDFLRSWEWEWLDQFSLTNYKLTLGVGAMLATIPGKYVKDKLVKRTDLIKRPLRLRFCHHLEAYKWWPSVSHCPSLSPVSGQWLLCRPVSPDSFTNAPTGLRADGGREGWHI